LKYGFNLWGSPMTTPSSQSFHSINRVEIIHLRNLP
jgi:hypothetical protein